MSASNSPTVLVTVFLNTPSQLTVDEDAKTQTSTSGRIETLIKELQEKGPLVATGYLGPKQYKAQPFELKDKIENQSIFGWKPGSRSKSGEQVDAIVVGARQVNDKGYVYFRLAGDYTLDRESYVREFRPTSDPRVFVSSYEMFRRHLVDLYPPVAKEKTHPNFVSSGSMACSFAELPYVIELASMMPLDSLFTEREQECKALGQKIFDTFKQANSDSSNAGREAVVRICDALRSCAKDGALRKQYVERVWDGIGDDHWRWQA